MANDTLKNLLDLAKQADEIVEKKQPVPQQGRKTERQAPTYITSGNFDERIAELDEQVFGKYQKPKDGYDPEEELKRIKSRTSEAAELEKKITNPILQEVLKNPYELNVDTVLNGCDPKRTQLEEKLNKKFGKIQEAQEISKTLEAKDREKVQTTVKTGSTTANIDYDAIRSIVEEAVERKITQLAGKLPLNEGVKGNKMDPMVILGENFTFVDGDGNMYKCGDMKYVGKMKIRGK